MVNLDFWKLFESNEKKSVTSARMYLITSFVSLSLLLFCLSHVPGEKFQQTLFQASLPETWPNQSFVIQKLP